MCIRDSDETAVTVIVIVVFLFGFILQVDVIVYVIPKIGEASEESVLLEGKGQIDVVGDFTFQVDITSAKSLTSFISTSAFDTIE